MCWATTTTAFARSTHEVLFGYDTAGRVSTLTDVDGNVTTIERDAEGNPTSVVSPSGVVTTLALDNNGYLAGVVGPTGSTYAMDYHDGLLSSIRFPTGSATDKSTKTYDALGRIAQSTDAAGHALTFVRSADDGSSLSVGKTTTAGVSTQHQLSLSSTGVKTWLTQLADGTTSKRVVNPDGSWTATGPDGTKSTYTPGPDPRFGMVSPVTKAATITTPSGLTRSMSSAITVSSTALTDPQALISETDTTTINGNVWTSTYVAASRSWTTRSPMGRTVTTTVDHAGRPLAVSRSKLATMMLSYDAQGRLESTAQGSRSTGREYDAHGYLSRYTDALGNPTQYVNDALGRPSQTTFADGLRLLASYDGDSNITSLTVPSGRVHGFDYTPVDLVKTYTPPAVNGSGANLTQYGYAADGQLAQTTRPDGLTEQRTYDSAGRLSTITLPTGVITYAYDPTTGATASITGPYGETLEYTRDGQLTTALTWSGPIAGSVSWTYNTDFRQVSEKVNAANSATFTYDADGLMTAAGAQTRTLDAASGMLSGTTLGNVTDSHTYNEYGEPASYTASYGGTSLLAVAYERDALGRIVTKTETVEGETHIYEYSYDLRGRLIDVVRDNVSAEHYEYDANGNRTRFSNGSSSVMGTYDDQDRMLAYGTKSYEYTANGELQSKTDGASMTTYHYDVRGALLRVDLPDGRMVEYVVDGTGRRVGKKVDGVLVQGLLYRSALQPVAELDSAGAVVGRFVYGGGVNVPEYVVRGTDTYRIITDHLGSVRMVVNVATGEVVQRMEYDSFGRVSVDEVASGFRRVPFGFAGGIYDVDTGLVRFGARDYDAETGRWTGKDPLRFGGGDSDVYAYVGGNPVQWRDPSGQKVFVCHDPAETTGGSILALLGFEHYWLKTDTLEAGLGPIPGGGTGLLGIGAKVYVSNEEGRSDPIKNPGTSAMCEEVSDVSEECVNSQLDYGKDLGRWWPTNQCYSYAVEVLTQCTFY